MKIAFRLFDARADNLSDISLGKDHGWLTKTFFSLTDRLFDQGRINIRVRLYCESASQQEKAISSFPGPKVGPLYDEAFEQALASNGLKKDTFFWGVRSCVEEGLFPEYIVEFIFMLDASKCDNPQIAAGRIYDYIKSEQSPLVANKMNGVFDYNIIFEKDIDASDSLSVKQFIADTIVNGLSFRPSKTSLPNVEGDPSKNEVIELNL